MNQTTFTSVLCILYIIIVFFSILVVKHIYRFFLRIQEFHIYTRGLFRSSKTRIETRKGRQVSKKLKSEVKKEGIRWEKFFVYSCTISSFYDSQFTERLIPLSAYHALLLLRRRRRNIIVTIHHCIDLCWTLQKIFHHCTKYVNEVLSLFPSHSITKAFDTWNYSRIFLMILYKKNMANKAPAKNNAVSWKWRAIPKKAMLMSQNFNLKNTQLLETQAKLRRNSNKE